MRSLFELVLFLGTNSFAQAKPAKKATAEKDANRRVYFDGPLEVKKPSYESDALILSRKQRAKTLLFNIKTGKHTFYRKLLSDSHVTLQQLKHCLNQQEHILIKELSVNNFRMQLKSPPTAHVVKMLTRIRFDFISIKY